MVWARLDDQFPDHRKVAPLSDAAFRLHVAGICHSSRLLTDGIIAKADVPRLVRGYRPKTLAELLAGVWHAEGHDCPDCVQPGPDFIAIHDFLDVNPSAHEVKTKQERRRAAGKKGGAASAQANAAANAQATGSAGGRTRGRTPTRPVPTDEDKSVGPSPLVAPARGSVVATRRQAAEVFTRATAMAQMEERPLLDSERDQLWEAVDELLRARHSCEDVARAVASANARTPNGVRFQIGRQRQPSVQSVGDRNLGAAAAWAAGKEA